jgi:hypothetical protein
MIKKLIAFIKKQKAQSISNKEKIKEWDKTTKWFDVCHIKGNTLLERCRYYITDIREDALRIEGSQQVLKLIKHAKPYIEWAKVQNLYISDPNYGIGLVDELNLACRYFKENKIDFPFDRMETFLYLLRELKLMKDIQFSNQWWTAMLYEVQEKTV